MQVRKSECAILGGMLRRKALRRKMKKTIIIGVAGDSASGKTTFTNDLQVKLSHGYKVKVIHMDEYYRAEEERPVVKGMYDGKQYVDDNHPLALHMNQILSDLADARTEDWEIIIVEGLFALWDSNLSAALDLKIYVDCEADERFARRIKRHLSYGQSYEEITNRYVQAVQPRQRAFVEPTKWQADLIVNGMRRADVMIEVILAWMKEKRNGHTELG